MALVLRELGPALGLNLSGTGCYELAKKRFSSGCYLEAIHLVHSWGGTLDLLMLAALFVVGCLYFLGGMRVFQASWSHSLLLSATLPANPPPKRVEPLIQYTPLGSRRRLCGEARGGRAPAPKRRHKLRPLRSLPAAPAALGAAVVAGKIRRAGPPMCWVRNVDPGSIRVSLVLGGGGFIMSRGAHPHI